ncbi:MAG TPA: hypothetical protein PLQ93_00260 [Bacteroidia bacterium]|nr:hypothetical protein [Bacteroidia bacterium]
MLLNAIEPNAVAGSGTALWDQTRKQFAHWFIILPIWLCSFVGLAQEGGLENLNYTAPSTFSPTIRDARKFSDLPEIKDSVSRIGNIKYGITSKPYFPKYQVQSIEAAKIQNEPLNKLYHALLKVGYGPIYNMPYGELWVNNTRSRESNFGFHARHYSGTPHLKGCGYGGFADDDLNLYGKKFYKKHSLFGDFNYQRNMVHYYGYDTSLYHSDKYDFSKQVYSLIEPRLRLLSHYTDSNHVNHDVRLSYYNLQNLQKETENRIKADAYTSLFVNNEKLNVNLLTDYYNHKQRYDTLNDLIVTINPNFEANGKQWQGRIGVSATMDRFRNKPAFYFYPDLYLQYNFYDNLLSPFAGAGGSLIKNSFRSLSAVNPYIDSTILFTNTNNMVNAFLGLKGKLSANTAYEVKGTYSYFGHNPYYVINFNDPNKLYNRYEILYDNTSLLNLSAQLKYQLSEKYNFIAKGNYYHYNTETLDYAYHKPDFDLTFTGIYNLDSKILLKADFFFVGKQWSRSARYDSTALVYENKQLNGYFDANLEAEYRYSKMLSFFARFNNIANQRYYRWDQYPSMRFHCMIGLSFVPF